MAEHKAKAGDEAAADPAPAPKKPQGPPRKSERMENVRVKHTVCGRFAQGDVVPAYCYDYRTPSGEVVHDVHRLAEMGAVEWCEDEATVRADINEVPIGPPPENPVTSDRGGGAMAK